jgi:hypothetical protein
MLLLLSGLIAACSSDSHGTPSSQAERKPTPRQQETTIARLIDPAPPQPVTAPAPPPVAAVIDAQAAAPDLPPEEADVGPDPFPAEVTHYMVERDGCDHFRGEEAYDEDRRAYLDESIRELCTGTDSRLAALRRRYAENPDVMTALQNYEDKIEPEEWVNLIEPTS